MDGRRVALETFRLQDLIREYEARHPDWTLVVMACGHLEGRTLAPLEPRTAPADGPFPPHMRYDGLEEVAGRWQRRLLVPPPPELKCRTCQAHQEAAEHPLHIVLPDPRPPEGT